MTWRWFYSTEESDTALKAVIDASEFSKDYSRNANSLTDGVFEYKVWIPKDSEFLLLQQKIDNMHIRAIASPVRITQFGNIRPDNYFDTTKYASGCAYRSVSTLAHMIAYLSTFPIGIPIAQRDIDIQGSAALGTVELTLSSLYKKTYNVPVNGSVSDRTLVKAIIDSTTPSATQTSAICNQAMFDYADPVGVPYLHMQDITAVIEYGTAAEWESKLNDKTISVASTADYNNGNVVFDYGSSKNRKVFFMCSIELVATFNIQTSVDGISYTTRGTSGGYNGRIEASFAFTETFRYIRLNIGNMRIFARELYVRDA